VFLCLVALIAFVYCGMRPRHGQCEPSRALWNSTDARQVVRRLEESELGDEEIEERFDYTAWVRSTLATVWQDVSVCM
jgi:hypothetical protein